MVYNHRRARVPHSLVAIGLLTASRGFGISERELLQLLNFFQRLLVNLLTPDVSAASGRGPDARPSESVRSVIELHRLIFGAEKASRYFLRLLLEISSREAN